jgi:hypothetical protein
MNAPAKKIFISSQHAQAVKDNDTVVASQLRHNHLKRVQQLQAEAEDQKKIAYLHTLRTQGKLADWIPFILKDRSWRNAIGSVSFDVMKFTLNAVSNSLPVNQTLKNWNLRADASCPLCMRPQTTQHVLSCCKFALDQGRYTWRHDSIVSSLGKWFIEMSKGPYLEGFEVIFDLASDQYVFPPSIIVTALRPDILLINQDHKVIILVEITAGSEENMVNAHEMKEEKYLGLCHELNENGWNTWQSSIEVCSRGFISSNINRLFRKMELPRSISRDVSKGLTTLAVKCSYYIYLHRNTMKWKVIEILEETLPFPSLSRQKHPSKPLYQKFTMTPSDDDTDDNDSVDDFHPPHDDNVENNDDTDADGDNEI